MKAERQKEISKNHLILKIYNERQRINTAMAWIYDP